MSRARIIKPDFFTSRSLAKVSRDARLMFQGLWCHCDAVGRGKADARIIKGAVFPLDDDLSLTDIEKMLSELHETGHIVLFAHNDEPLYEVVNFAKHQAKSYRTGEAKHPGPDDDGSIRATCTTTHAECTSSRALREGKGREVNAHQPDAHDDFQEFWNSYPRKVDRKRANTAWKNLTIVDQAAALEALPRHVRSWRGADTKHIPHPTTWLHGRRWEDQITTTPTGKTLDGGGFHGGDW